MGMDGCLHMRGELMLVIGGSYLKYFSVGLGGWSSLPAHESPPQTLPKNSIAALLHHLNLVHRMLHPHHLHVRVLYLFPSPSPGSLHLLCQILDLILTKFLSFASHSIFARHLGPIHRPPLSGRCLREVYVVVAMWARLSWRSASYSACLVPWSSSRSHIESGALRCRSS